MPLEVVRRRDPDAVREILASIPVWFGIPESNENFVVAAGRTRSYRAVDGDEVIGVALVNEHFPPCRELHLIAVRRDRHRTGAGRALLAEIETDLRPEGVRLLEVGTVGPSDDDEATRELASSVSPPASCRCTSCGSSTRRTRSS
jgi:GNAT superfamily N-acetyltransferase